MLKRKYNEKNVIDAINYIDSLKNLDVNFKRELLEHLHNIKKTKKITQLVNLLSGRQLENISTFGASWYGRAIRSDFKDSGTQKNQV